MPVSKPDYQLTFELDLTPSPSPEGEGSLSVEEIRLRSEAAREVLESPSSPLRSAQGGVKWLDEYNKLREGGWDWRVAAYIAWASSPRNNRVPKTQDELATQHLGLTSDRAINTWRKKNPAIDEMVGMLQQSPLWDHRADVFNALAENAVRADYKTHNDRKLFLEMTGDYVPSAKLAAMITKNGFSKNELSEMSDEDLLNLAKNLRDEVVKEEDE